MGKHGSRRREILEGLAHMLEVNAGERITTARLAEAVGVSEAALYRHFPSKAKMFEGLIEFVEESIFSRVGVILEGAPPALEACEKMLRLLLTFTERNPGITRILAGDALVGENERLRERVGQLYDRLETQLRQVLRNAELYEGQRTCIPVGSAANLLLAAAEGRIVQFVRSGFRSSPTADWDQQWLILSSSLMRSTEVESGL